MVTDGVVDFDGEGAESTASGAQWDFSLQLDGDPIPVAI